MAKPLKTDKLIRSIKRKAMIPQDQVTFDTDDFLEMINEEIQTTALSHLLTVHEEYLVYFVDVQFQAGQQSYEIPARAVGNRLRDVHYVDSNGDIIREASRVSLEELMDYKYNNDSTYTGQVYIQNNKLVIIGAAPQSLASIRMYFYLSPSEVVRENETGTITSIDTVSGIVTVDNFPTKFSNTTTFDFVSSRNPNNVVSFDVDAVSTDSVTKSATFSLDDLPSDLKVGDYLCVAEETPVPQIPSELHPILAQRVAIYCLESLNDTEGITNAQRKLIEGEKATWDLVDNRIEGANQKMNNRHGAYAQASVSPFYQRSSLSGGE